MSEHVKTRKAEGTWVVRAGGAVIGESNHAVELTEGEHPFIIYFPRDDIAMAFLEPSTSSSHCPHKGDATYYSIQTKSHLIKDAAWSYEAPKSPLEHIAGHIAFYATDKVAIERI